MPAPVAIASSSKTGRIFLIVVGVIFLGVILYVLYRKLEKVRQSHQRPSDLAPSAYQSNEGNKPITREDLMPRPPKREAKTQEVSRKPARQASTGVAGGPIGPASEPQKPTAPSPPPESAGKPKSVPLSQLPYSRKSFKDPEDMDIG